MEISRHSEENIDTVNVYISLFAIKLFNKCSFSKERGHAVIISAWPRFVLTVGSLRLCVCRRSEAGGYSEESGSTLSGDAGEDVVFFLKQIFYASEHADLFGYVIVRSDVEIAYVAELVQI